MCAATLFIFLFGFPYWLTPAFSTPAILTVSHFPLLHFQSPPVELSLYLSNEHVSCSNFYAVVKFTVRYKRTEDLTNA